MSGQFIDANAPSLQGKNPKRPEDLPRGLITPPREVLELIEKERGKHPPEAFARAEGRLLNEWTIQYYFDYLGHEVLVPANAPGTRGARRRPRRGAGTEEVAAAPGSSTKSRRSSDTDGSDPVPAHGSRQFPAVVEHRRRSSVAEHRPRPQR